MTVYVTNLCPNPSFEVDLTGWSALTGTTIAQDDTYALVGQNAMLVTTDGSITGEGFTGPGTGTIGSATTGAIGLDIYPLTDCTLNIEAVNSDGTVLASTLAGLTAGVYQRIILQDFTVPVGGGYSLLVATNAPEALNLWVDAVQYETGVTAASAYIDGDQPGCAWTGSQGESTSELLYLNATSASGTILVSGRATPVDVGLDFYTSASGSVTMSGDLQPSIASPTAAFADFAIFELTDNDPAMTYVDQNNAAANSGSGSTYASNYGLFYPPLDYPVSNNNYAWRRAAFMGVGFYFTGVTASQEQNLTDVEVALAPLTGSTPVPAAFTPPRQIATIIKPTRLNFCPNPSFEVSTAGWTATGSGVLSQDSTTVPTPSYNTLLNAGNLPGFFNSTGITSDGSTGYGNLDGYGYSYSAQQLAISGLGAGATVLSGGIEYVMPPVPANAADNVQCKGQVIPISAAPGASLIGFLGAAAGAASGANQSGTVTITYTDGTTGTATLGLSDWTLDAGAGSVGYGNQIVGTIPYRNESNGTSTGVTSYVYSQVIPCNSAKTVASITLPNNAYMHVFGVSLAVPSSTPFGTYSCKIAIHANGDGMSISIPDLIVGDTYTVSMYTEVGPGVGAVSMQCGSASTTLSNASDSGVPYGGTQGLGYGQGYYGGVSGTTTDLAQSVWYRPSLTFTASASTETFIISTQPGPDVSYPTEIWVDSVLFEAGELVLPYFDGSFGSTDYLDYQWETGGTAGLTRSYYYEQFKVKQYSVNQILSQHIPVGLVAASPSYLVPYTQ
jgi:hypothetical protein